MPKYVFTEDDCKKWRSLPDSNPKSRYPIQPDPSKTKHGIVHQLIRQCNTKAVVNAKTVVVQPKRRRANGTAKANNAIIKVGDKRSALYDKAFSTFSKWSSPSWKFIIPIDVGNKDMESMWVLFVPALKNVIANAEFVATEWDAIKDLKLADLKTLSIILRVDVDGGCVLTLAYTTSKQRWLAWKNETKINASFAPGEGLATVACDVFVGLMDALRFTVFKNILTEASNPNAMEDVEPLMQEAASYIHWLRKTG